ncbi:MAG TPA: alpha/beta fold hydrolase, partial [Gammaproteobacteria bacterium]|nr:alpha/beta fold hydrolase [Gammaproteobacteria bacterium]
MPARAPRAASIAGPVGALEARIDAPTGPAVAAAVVCHPHPLHGGTLHNKVAYTLAKAFTRLGAAAVRFNFRGVGASEGRHADGAGELDDALAVVEWTRREWPGAPLYLGGFSFGADVALRAAVALGAETDRNPVGLVTVALPVGRVPADFPAPRCPWLVIHGDRDEVVALD